MKPPPSINFGEPDSSVCKEIGRLAGWMECRNSVLGEGGKILFSYLCQDGSFNPSSQGVPGVFFLSEYNGTGVQLTAQRYRRSADCPTAQAFS